jgi:hypothetical protein
LNAQNGRSITLSFEFPPPVFEIWGKRKRKELQIKTSFPLLLREGKFYHGFFWAGRGGGNFTFILMDELLQYKHGETEGEGV